MCEGNFLFIFGYLHVERNRMKLTKITFSETVRYLAELADGPTLYVRCQGLRKVFRLVHQSAIAVAVMCLLYRMSQEECARLREGVPYVKVYRYNPKHLYPKLNGYADNDQRKVGASCGSKYCNLHS